MWLYAGLQCIFVNNYWQILYFRNHQSDKNKMVFKFYVPMNGAEVTGEE